MTMSDWEKPVFCPWCGAEMRPTSLTEYGSSKPAWYFYECGRDSCDCTSPMRETKDAAYVAATRCVQSWKTAERVLPLEEMYVIGYNAKKMSFYPSLRYDPDKYEFYDEMYNDKPVRITHWMPFPDAPKEE